ncbi:methyltransferase domain-containing protein [Mesorhizobium sp. GbtcB19]|uniref:methyltransferase domain-containing protein n=1 Tax=Mesorhizobium sp. GbtcB19 TaxID=2824764 RepID=UPI001C308E19|nr:methyltransferase domain-containing protein [Mesorhizobium sp. GbtcB19]
MGQLVRDWEGQPVFILAGGPSVLGQDLSLLKGQRVIAINSAHLAYPQADVLFYADADWWTLVGSKEPPFAGEIITTSGIGPKTVTRLIKDKPDKGISPDPRRAALSATSVSGGLHVAVHRGGGPVFLLGVDGKTGEGGRRHHHNGRYPNPLKKGWFDRHNAELASLAPSIAALGVKVFNCSPVSDLSCWPKIDFLEAIAMAQAQQAKLISPLVGEMAGKPEGGAVPPALRPVAPPSALPGISPTRGEISQSPKPSLVALGMYGMGDCLHQRAVVRELMKTHDVELQTFYTAMYHDLKAEGLKVTLVDGRLPPRIRDQGNDNRAARARINHSLRIGYDHAQTRKHGTLLAAMFGSAGLPVPERPDFSLPVKPEWRAAARALVGDTGGRPLMIYRPIIINGTWPCPSRSPDPAAYAALYQSIKDRFFTVSICDLTQKGEQIVGEEQPTDLKLHRGEADFETLAGLFAEASLVFGNAGFTPILAQAVGTPNIVVYGGNESFRYTNIVGAHLAPTLPIEPVKPCECFERHHNCDKTIDLEAALPKVEAFAAAHAATPRVLVFGTVFTDTPDKQRLAAQWQTLHRSVNGWNVDLLLVDSASPLPLPLVEDGVQEYAFPDNIGHLARGGADGWGRAFCKGLEIAVDGQYDYVVHVEGDSLFLKPVLPIIRRMLADGIKAASVPVAGTKRQETGWAETGLMFFSVDYLWQSKFIERYAWRERRPRPFPEQAIFDLLGEDLVMLPLNAERGDRGQITGANAAGFDWITHCAPEALDAFVEAAMPAPVEATIEREQAPRVKLNFGCGTNRLEGWQNFDAEIDIEKPLPFADGSADFIYAEHVVEHVDYHAGLRFLAECRRVLKPGGVIRIAVPSLENIWKRGDQAYFDFARKWAPSADRRGAMHAIIHAHGHKAIWTQSLLEACLYFAGFDDVVACQPHQSAHADLVDVEGHHKVIGEAFNTIETAIAEGRAA